MQLFKVSQILRYKRYKAIEEVLFIFSEIYFSIFEESRFFPSIGIFCNNKSEQLLCKNSLICYNKDLICSDKTLSG